MHDVVALVGSIADDGAQVPRGSRGVVIAEYPSDVYYEVEFRTNKNQTFAVSTVAASDLHLVKADPGKRRALD